MRCLAGTLGSCSSPVASPCGRYTTVGVCSRELPQLHKLGSALQLPGNANLRGELVRFVVAEDLFSLCTPEMRAPLLAAKKSILKWAGSDQAGSVQLCR